MPKKQLTALFVFFLTLGFYVYTLLPSLAWGDGVKLQSEAIAGESFVLAEMSPDEFTPDPFPFSKVGVAAWDHPLYIVLGHGLVRAFPLVDSLWMVNFISALFGAATVALLFLLGCRFTESLFASLYASISLAVSHTFWWHASTPEVYTLFVFLLLASFYLFERFESTQKHNLLAYSAFFFGLAASTHVMAFLAIPALGLYFVSSNIRAQGCLTDAHSLPEITEKMGARGGARPHAHPFFRDFLGTLRCNTKNGGENGVQHPISQIIKKFAMLMIGFLTGFSLYLIQFVRMSANFPLDEIIGPVVGSTFLSRLGTFSPLLLGQSLLSYLFFLSVQFGPVGLGLGALGLRKVFDAENRSLRKIVAFFVVYALFGIFYRVTDQFTFFIPSYVFWALLMGIGADAALGLYHPRRGLPGKWRSLFPVLLGLLILATPVFYTALPRLAERNGLKDASIGIPEIGVGVRNGLAYYINPDKRGDHQAYDFGHRTLTALPPNSVVIAEWYTDTDEYFIFRYFTKIQKLRPDVTVVGWPTQDPFSFDPQLTQDVVEDAIPERAVYLASLSEKFYAASELIEKYCIVPESNLYRLYQKADDTFQCLGRDAVTK